MIIEDLDDFYEKYEELIYDNKGEFTKKIFDILNSEKHYINEKLGLRDGIQQLLELKNKEDTLYIEKIVARGYGKEIMFLILNYAIKNNIKLLKLKAEPLFLKNDETFNNRQNYLSDFYGYFGFSKIDLNGNMILDFEESELQTLNILYNRLLNYINK